MARVIWSTFGWLAMYMRLDQTRKPGHGPIDLAARPSVYGMGFIALDVVRNESRTQAIRTYAGGTCGNVLAALAYLRWNAFPIARLNGDPASERVKADFLNIGVRLDLAEYAPTVSTPIVVQVISKGTLKHVVHRFEWTCPTCGTALPRFRPVPSSIVPRIATRIVDPRVFFMDRVSRSALKLAEVAANRGAIVYFEPSEIGDPALFKQALRVANIVKYSSDRIRSPGIDGTQTNIHLEIKTFGGRGLAYRSPVFGKRTWTHMPAVLASIVKDTCGAGDWCSAGIVAALGADGLPGLLEASPAKVAEALRYGQALAAWNCRFDGARGGMYETEPRTLTRHLEKLLGETRLSHIEEEPRQSLRKAVTCPACPPNGERGAGRSKKRGRPIRAL